MAYRKIDPRIWNDAAVRALGDDGRLLFLFVLTHPAMTSLGAMRATAGGLAEELGWTRRRFDSAWAQLLAPKPGSDPPAYLVQYDPEASCVAAVNFQKYNRPESVNVVRAWVRAVDLIPECALRREVVERAALTVLGMGHGFREAFRDAFAHAFGDAFAHAIAKASVIQEQEQEQEQEQYPKGVISPHVDRTKNVLDEALWFDIPETRKVLTALGVKSAQALARVTRNGGGDPRRAVEFFVQIGLRQPKGGLENPPGWVVDELRKGRRASDQAIAATTEMWRAHYENGKPDKRRVRA